MSVPTYTAGQLAAATMPTLAGWYEAMRVLAAFVDTNELDTVNTTARVISDEIVRRLDGLALAGMQERRMNQNATAARADVVPERDVLAELRALHRPQLGLGVVERVLVIGVVSGARHVLDVQHADAAIVERGRGLDPAAWVMAAAEVDLDQLSEQPDATPARTAEDDVEPFDNETIQAVTMQAYGVGYATVLSVMGRHCARVRAETAQELTRLADVLVDSDLRVTTHHVDIAAKTLDAARRLDEAVRAHARLFHVHGTPPERDQ